MSKLDKSKILKKYLEKYESNVLREYEEALKYNLYREFLTDWVFSSNENAVALVNSLSNKEVEALHVGLITGALKNDTLLAFNPFHKGATKWKKIAKKLKKKLRKMLRKK